MADRKPAKFVVDPALRQQIVESEEDIEIAQDGLLRLKDMGLDIQELQDKLDWVKKIKGVLLRD